MSPAELESFYRGIHPKAVEAGHDLLAKHDFSSRRTLLDVGGGAGGLAITVAQRWSHIHSTVVELPRVVPITQHYIEESGVEHLVQAMAVVVGAVQREGKIILQVVPDRSRKTLHAFADKAVSDEAEAIHTDDWRPYRGVGDEDTLHETVNHSIGEYARGNVNTNSVENIWSLLKPSIIGSFHKVSIKHLDAYLDELEWRFNNRDNPLLFRDTLIQLLWSENLPYQQLVQ